ncbi:FAD-dependent oxidoreductase [Streptomyces sp. NPDC047061]|uniref:FAD-dependent oxidoreductase n=1 Tax=Streptomyces sp. NPDC047061 TaxID=3154605 RepID=UPI0033CAFBE6
MSTSSKFDHAVVIGASIAGLLAAGAASKSFEKVTVIERDTLEDKAEPRKGVPQGAQIHALLPAGLKRMQAVLPGLREDLLAEGGAPFDEAANVVALTGAGWRLRVPGQEWVATRRPLLELVIRRRVQALPNVEIVQASVAGLEVTEDRSKVTGVTLRDGSSLDADLVINATGRRTKAPDWLAAHGVEAPAESFVNAYTGYATQFVRLPDDALKHGVIGLGALPWPGEHRGIALFPADNGTHALTAVGMMRDYPPRDREGVIEFLSESTTPLSAEIARKAEPVSDVNTYHIDGSLLRRWNLVPNMPDRFLAVGDSAASMNPIYGQGMSLSAAAAVLVLEHLAAADNLDGVARAIQNDLAPILDGAFGLAGSTDACFEGAEWSDDFTPMSEQDAARGLAMEVLATQNPNVSSTVNDALYDLRPEDLETEEFIALCDKWIAEGNEIPPFDREQYPTSVTPIDATA